MKENEIIESERPNFREVIAIPGSTKTIAAVKFSPDGKLLAAGCADKTVRIFNAETGDVLEIFYGHSLGISDVYV